MVFDPPRAPVFRPTIAVLEASSGNSKPHYAIPLDFPLTYKWVPGSTTADDNVTSLSHQGGTVGRWILIRVDIKGDDLTDAAENIGVGGKFKRVQSATLTASRIKTLVTTNAEAGDIIRILRLDSGAFTMVIVNGGSGGGTLFTLPAGEQWFADSYFNGTDWEVHGAGKLP